MICKYCGKPLSGRICTSCKKAVILSYKSHELSDMLGLDETAFSLSLPPDEEQLRAIYEEGFSSGKKRGYSIGWNAAQKDASKNYKRKQHNLMIIVASAMVLLAVICSFTFNGIGSSRRYDVGYQKGIEEGKKKGRIEQEFIDLNIIIDDNPISGTLQREYNKGYNDGYEEGKAAGYQQESDEM